jgi:thymidylate synthase (FAD)
MTQNNAAAERSARLVWVTPDADKLVAYMARVSAPQNQHNDATAERLIGYLIRHRHWSPFEMVSACMEIETTRDIARQLLRHRSFSFQEFSQRYASVAALPEAPLRPARMQDAKNRQASTPTGDEALQQVWERWQRIAQDTARDAYEWALSQGIAREVARAVLPEGLTTSRLYMAGTIRSWLHFCDLRRGNGTQLEAQRVADDAWTILREACPAICAAWETSR